MRRGLDSHASTFSGPDPKILCPAAPGIDGRTPAAAPLWSMIPGGADGSLENPNQHSCLKYHVTETQGKEHPCSSCMHLGYHVCPHVISHASSPAPVRSRGSCSQLVHPPSAPLRDPAPRAKRHPAISLSKETLPTVNRLLVEQDKHKSVCTYRAPE